MDVGLVSVRDKFCLRKNISANAENQGVLYASSIGSANGNISINVFRL